MSLLYLKKVVHSSTRQILRKKNISQKLSLKKLKRVSLLFSSKLLIFRFKGNTVHVYFDGTQFTK